ncbi:MAG: ATP-binding cassette domain-containing protein [Clostridia bacterium]|nr:ATP-binding cassette domain-containing protein [Clostridia bacterium]
MAQLLFKNVNKVYPNGYHAVHDFNMEIKNGEFICLVGDSGCGKSTTLRMIAGLEDITAGDFILDGKLANQMSSRDRGIAMVFQSYALYPHLTVAENLGFGLQLEGIDADVIEERVQATAKILGLTDYLERFPRNLSGGQCQRVAVGRALIRKVNIFLMDEPLSNLDAKQRVTMRSEIKQIHRSVGSTTIYVTHDQTEAMTMSDRIVVMKSGGWIQQIGSPCELYFHPCNLFVAGFIGDPPMNFLKGEVHGGKFVTESGETSLDITPLVANLADAEGRKVLFAYRPEAVKLAHEKAGKQEYEVTTNVELTEFLGDTTNVYATIGDHNVIMKVNPHYAPKVGEDFKIYVPYAASYLIDVESELCFRSNLKRNDLSNEEQMLKDVDHKLEVLWEKFHSGVPAEQLWTEATKIFIEEGIV